MRIVLREHGKSSESTFCRLSEEAAPEEAGISSKVEFKADLLRLRNVCDMRSCCVQQSSDSQVCLQTRVRDLASLKSELSG